MSREMFVEGKGKVTFTGSLALIVSKKVFEQQLTLIQSEINLCLRCLPDEIIEGKTTPDGDLQFLDTLDTIEKRVKLLRKASRELHVVYGEPIGNEDDETHSADWGC